MVENNYLLGIDVGTSSCKTAFFGIDGRIVAKNSRNYLTSYPQEEWAEQDATQWWKAVTLNIREILEKSKIKPSRICAIGVSSQGSVVLPVDRKGQALRPAMIWMDRRSTMQCNWIKHKVGQDTIYQINGNHIDPSNMAPKILWLKENEPSIYQSTYKFMHANGYIIHKLTGKFSVDISEGGLTQLFDTKNGKWSEELIRACNIDKNKLPEVFDCSEVVGKVTQEAAIATGLVAGIPVVAGSMDMVASAVGCGASKEGQAYVAAGTVIAMGICVDSFRCNPALHIYHHALPKKWLLAAGVDFGGGSLHWFKNEFGNSLISQHQKNNPYYSIDEFVRASPPGARGLIFLPYMKGQRAPLWNDHVRGVIFGISPSHTKGDLIRALMEGSGFGLYNIIEIVEKEGFKVTEIYLSGGCSKSKVWDQIFSDITGKCIVIPYYTDELTVYGSALLAGMGVGVFSKDGENLPDIPAKSVFKCHPKYQIRYKKSYEVFKRIYKHLCSDFDFSYQIRSNF